MTSNEENTVEQMVLDTLSGDVSGVKVAQMACDTQPVPKLAPLVREIGWAKIHLLSLRSEVRNAA